MPTPEKKPARKLDGEAAVLEKIAGVPAYYENGVHICFFHADKYLTLGLAETANHDLPADAPHRLRPSAWFFDELDEATEAEIARNVVKAVG